MPASHGWIGLYDDTMQKEEEGSVEKCRQRRSCPLAVLTSLSYAPPSKWLRLCWTGLFEHSLILLYGSWLPICGPIDKILRLFNSPIGDAGTAGIAGIE
jgi:hypothetical protein